MSFTSCFWRRLDTPGHDVCRLAETAEGWRLYGTAVFAHELGTARVNYLVQCDHEWRTRYGRVDAWIGARTCKVNVQRSADGVWSVDDNVVGGLADCFDLDFGFTPATNILQLRRMALEVGNATDIAVAWLDVPDATLIRLPQRYERRTALSYWYESPSGPYAALMELADSGFVRNYPDLWQLEAADEG
jgi:uncharacterized protein